MDYHAHVYFDAGSREKAEAFRQRHEKPAAGLGLWVGELVDKKVGPHPLPMFEVHVSDRALEQYVRFIEANNPGLNILLHEDTGDDRRDHDEGARWFGKKLDLDFGFFDRLAQDESLRVHPLKKS